MRGVSHSRASLTAHQPNRVPLLASQFAQFFVTTPQDLIHDGLYKALALALYPAPFNKVSCCLVARALGAIDMHATSEARLRAGEALRNVRGSFRSMSSRALDVSVVAASSEPSASVTVHRSALAI